MAMFDSLYPYFGVAKLQEQHGARWGDIIERVRALPVTDPHMMAFTLTVKKIRKQYNVPADQCKDPFCAVCTAEVLSHFQGSEDDLIRVYYDNLREVNLTLKQMRAYRIERPVVLAQAGSAA